MWAALELDIARLLSGVAREELPQAPAPGDEATPVTLFTKAAGDQLLVFVERRGELFEAIGIGIEVETPDVYGAVLELRQMPRQLLLRQ